MKTTLSTLSVLAILTTTVLASPTPHHSANHIECTHPVSFYIVNFEEHINKLDTNGGEAMIAFRFVGLDTGIDTQCQGDNITLTDTVKREDEGLLQPRHHHDHDMMMEMMMADRYPCEDKTIAFVYDKRLGLTVVESVCPAASDAPFEAAGSVSADKLKLTCADTDRESACKSSDKVLSGTFVSFGPPPPSHGGSQ